MSTCPEDDNSYCQLFRRTEASIKLYRDHADLQRLHTQTRRYVGRQQVLHMQPPVYFSHVMKCHTKHNQNVEYQVEAHIKACPNTWTLLRAVDMRSMGLYMIAIYV